MLYRRRRSGLRRDGGASAVEYGAILILVAALAAVFTVVALPERLKTSTAAAICQLFSGTDTRDCPDDQPPPAEANLNNGEPNPGDGPAATTPELPGPAETQPPAAVPAGPAVPALDPDDPDVQKYNDAKREADAADQDLEDLNDLSDEAKQEIIDLLKDLVGITDIEDCLTKGDLVACISALAGFVPWGKVLKVLKKIPGAVKLAKRLKELWDKLGDARDRKKKADKALEDAEDKLKDKGVCPVKPPNSFLPGTRVLLADGTARPIERIRVGDLVWAADPLTGVQGPRAVTHLITGQGSKRLATLAIGPFGLLGPAITATADHPFWNLGTRTWQGAGDLTPGSLLHTPEGRTTLTSVRRHTATARVHNLTVADLHTYYVLAGNTPVLVHNSGGCGDAIIDPGKWDYLFGRVTKGSHNAPRSAQNLSQLNRIGIHDTPEGRQILQEFFDGQVSGSGNIIREYTDQYGTFQIRDGLLSGPGGFLHVESAWQVTDNGLRLTTIIPRGGP